MSEIKGSEKRKKFEPLDDIDPKIDPAFKAVTAVKKLTLSLLNQIFDATGYPEAIDFVYENVEMEGVGYFGKGATLDLLVTLKDQMKIAVEMQIQDHLDMPIRLQFYASKIFTHQFKKGMSHGDDQILPTLVIGILAFNLKFSDSTSMINNYRFYDPQTKSHLADNMINIVTIELPKLEQYIAEQGRISELGYWLAFFRHTEEDQILVEEYEMTKEAVLVLESKRLDDSFGDSYRQAKELLNDEMSRMKTYSHNRYKLGRVEGREEGREERNKEIILNSIAKGTPLELVANLLGLSLEYVKSVGEDAKRQ